MYSKYVFATYTTWVSLYKYVLFCAISKSEYLLQGAPHKHDLTKVTIQEQILSRSLVIELVSLIKYPVDNLQLK